MHQTPVAQDPTVLRYRNPMHRAEHAYLEALATHGFGSPECRQALIALRRVRHAGRDGISMGVCHLAGSV
jgi:hypothetical protein